MSEKKTNNKIKLLENNNTCLVCYGTLVKNDVVNLCSNFNMKHAYHKSCFDDLLKYNCPKFTVDIFNNKLYECTYCKEGVDKTTLFTVV